MSEQFDLLAKEIHDRLDSVDERVSEEKIRAMISESLTALLQDSESDFVRKMRFGGQEPNKLAGSKFARWDLNHGDVEFLYDLMVARQNQGVGQGPSEELEGAFRAISDAFYIPQEEIRRMDRQALDNVFPRVPVNAYPVSDRAYAASGQWFKTQAYQDAVRAMDTAESGYGSQLVGAQYVGDLWEAARRQSRVFALLNSFEMTAPTAYLPVEADIPEMLFVSENTASDSSNYDTVKTGSNRVTVSAKKFVIHQIWSGEMEEDSIIPFVPFLRRQSVISVAHYSDSLVLNGDTTNAATGNINLDDADPADTKHYLAFDGIRHAALADNTDNASDCAAAVSLSKLNGLRPLMLDSTYLMDWANPADKNDLVWVCDPDTGHKIALLDEVITVDKYGPQATVKTGEVAQVLGHSLISSMAMSKTEADGKVSTTAANNTKGQVALFNRRGFAVGRRRRVKLETERLPARDQTRLVYSLRLGLGRYSPTGAASGLECAAVLYDITV